MASSYVDPSAREPNERRRGAYSGGWNGARTSSRGDESEGLSRGDGLRGDEARNNARDEFVSNEELGEPVVRMMRAPADADAIDWCDDGGTCFACTFVKKKSEVADPFNDREAQDAYTDMMRLIRDNYTRISNPELVKLVDAFYQDQIQPLGFGPWTSKSIARHLLFHTNDEDTLMQESTDMLYSQIQSLRTRTWFCNDGVMEPHHKNIAAMERLIRSLDDHLTKKKNRKM
jgi:hypothetical protein